MTDTRIIFQSPVTSGFTRGIGGPGSGGHRGSSWYMSAGMDFGAPVGTRVYAAFDGYVDTCNPHDRARDTSHVYGAQIFIHDARDVISSFWTHLTDIPTTIRRRARIARGAFLGTIYAPRGMAPHLHLAIVQIQRGQPPAPVNIYRALIGLSNTPNTCTVEFHSDRSAPTLIP